MSTPKGTAKREAIVTAAAEILVAAGLESVTHRAVAARAGVPLGSTTYHFSGLDDLQRAAADRIADDDITRMTDAIVDLPTRQRSAATAARMIVGLVVPAGDHELLTWYERYARAAREPALASAAQRTNRVALDTVNAVLQASGWSDSPDAALVLATADGAVLGALADGHAADAARKRASDLLTTLLESLSPPR